MPRHTPLNTTHCMRTSKSLAVIMFVSTILGLLDVQSPAQGFKLELPAAKPTLRTSAPQYIGKATPGKQLVLTQNLENTSRNLNINKDLMLQEITITQSSYDKSLLTVKGFINNHSEQSHYVYYIVAKFISNDTAIKQTIIPVNIDLEPGQSQAFTHEISTNSVKSISLDTVKPLVVKYEYR